MARKGIDVSEHKVFSESNYAALANQIEWVIVREGYGTSSLDHQVINQIAGFKRYNVPIIGTFHFIYAINDREAKENAENCIRNIKALGLPDGIRVWCDFEYDTVDKAAKRGVKLGAEECRRFTKIFCDAMKAAGYRTGIYTNGDFYKNWYGKAFMKDYDLWLADYTGGPDYACVIQQYAEGYLPGYKYKLDLDWLYDDNEMKVTPEVARVATQEERDALMDRDEVITRVINIASMEVGYKEKASNACLDDKTANAGSANWTKYGRDMHKIQPSNMDLPAPWCDAFVDWVFYKAFGADTARKMLCGTFDDYTVISADYYKRAGRWYTSGKKGDQIFFKNSGGICHTGIVYKVSGNKVYTIEGNVSNAVCYREYYAGDSYIAGYGRPKYELACDELTDGSPKKTVEQIAKEVIVGMWGNGDDRKRRLTLAGYDYNAVQKKVNELLKVGAAQPLKTTEELAREVIAGMWGNGDDRKKRLTEAGYSYDSVQKEVNRLLGH